MTDPFTEEEVNEIIMNEILMQIPEAPFINDYKWKDPEPLTLVQLQRAMKLMKERPW